jgi:DNA repair exonuclease SbcCD ATPase subunit
MNMEAKYEALHSSLKGASKELQDTVCKLIDAEAKAAALQQRVDHFQDRVDYWMSRAERAEARVTELEEAIQLAQELHKELYEQAETLQERLDQIRTWCDAYPLDIFPEPDLKEARRLLETGGMTLDAVSAQAMRHVLNGIRIIIEEEGK